MQKSTNIVLQRDCRKRWYFVISVPYNADGQGPVSYSECNVVRYEVWDQCCDTFGSFDYLPDAINYCEDLNEVYSEAKR